MAGVISPLVVGTPLKVMLSSPVLTLFLILMFLLVHPVQVFLWHLFVVAGSLCHFLTVLLYVI